ncbi:acyl-phosphate glycerol-3-phosphate acyltransferase [Geosporobacter subterraneus DSM 17957]|uniref:Glycerol-3-phosphate acyltransferase n=1 Tax=Geosporobacter subterraneus DSM 17957 TaxID=1121919 RepID=A0A1M6GU15_9FIRM|nr:glycerol-3-phosphate 1-O-acyltransferase PlsY [Geosporobacter subterraneus]SHJ13448.1 acyl-phosphate glycerol-3-phosphate acyltransferase [Geosporobacter subterraneus DSM 17957]
MMFMKSIAVLLSYFIGNFSTSMIVSKLWANIDIRKYGSGNAGSTNVLRTLGFKPALVTFIGDALKGILAVWIGGKLGGTDTALLCGIAAIIGHNWPVLFGFKGGKGIATSIGVGLAVNQIVAFICIALGIMIVVKTKYVSLGSITAISLLPILFIFSGFKYFLFGLVLALMAIFQHRQNIQRLLKGTESKIGQKSRTR